MAKKNQALEDYLRLHPEERGIDIGKKFGVAEETVCRARSRLAATKEFAEPLAERVRRLLQQRKKRWTIVTLSTALDVGIGRVIEAIEELNAHGANIVIQDEAIVLSTEIPRAKPQRIDTSGFSANRIRFGLTADNHLGSKYERLDVLNALFDIWQQQGITTVYQLGNIIEGERHSKFDIHTYGMQNQVDYLVKNWPRRKGMVTKFITGDDHEGWYVQDEGINIGKFIQMTAESAGRQDLQYLGHMEHDILLQAKNGKSVMRLIHAGGGSSYATSYSVQKIVESYQGGEKPQILLVGHYHKAEYGYPREVHVVQAGCTKDQDSFLRKNKIQAHIGGWTIEFTQSQDGLIHAFTPSWHPFYDRGYYDRAWQYKW